MIDANRANSAVHAHRDPILNGAKYGGTRTFLDLDIHPRSYLMKRALLNFVLPVLAVGIITVTFLYPKPTDLQAAIEQSIVLADPKIEITYSGPTDVRPFVEDYTDVVPGLQRTLTENAECFIDLDQATPAKLERCAPAVTDLIAQVVAYQDNPVVVHALQNEGNQRFLQQLQVAAVEVCRLQWASGDSIDYGLDSPACQVAQVQLVPGLETR